MWEQPVRTSEVSSKIENCAHWLVFMVDEGWKVVNGKQCKKLRPCMSPEDSNAVVWLPEVVRMMGWDGVSALLEAVRGQLGAVPLNFVTEDLQKMFHELRICRNSALLDAVVAKDPETGEPWIWIPRMGEVRTTRGSHAMLSGL